MQRHKSILVAVDGSEAGFNALSESIRLARWSRGTVTALMVAPPYDGDLSLVGVGDIKGAILGPLGETMKHALDVAEFQGFPIFTVCEQGEMHQKLADTAASRGSDLIVLGVSGKASLFRILAGDTTVTKLFTCTRKDVLLLPDRTAIGWERILFLTTEEDIGCTVSDRAIALAAAYGGSMRTLVLRRGCLWSRGKSCCPDGNGLSPTLRNYLDEIQAKAHRAGVESETLPRPGATLAAIGSVLNESDADLMVMASQGKTGLRGLLTGQSLERIVHHFARPVLVPGI
jgi:nucleotide-binding universal stress UspA family protein